MVTLLWDSYISDNFIEDRKIKMYLEPRSKKPLGCISMREREQAFYEGYDLQLP